MVHSKSWFLSKTILGVIITVIGFVCSQYFQVDISNIPPDPDAVQALEIIQTIKTNHNNIQVIASNIVVLLGAILAIVGRVKAEAKIS